MKMEAWADRTKPECNLVIRVLAWLCFQCEKKNWCRLLYFVFPFSLDNSEIPITPWM